MWYPGHPARVPAQPVGRVGELPPFAPAEELPPFAPAEELPPLRLRRSCPPLRLQSVEAGNSLFVNLNGAAVSDFLYRRGPTDWALPIENRITEAIATIATLT